MEDDFSSKLTCFMVRKNTPILIDTIVRLKFDVDMRISKLFGYPPLTLKEGPKVKSDHIRRFLAHDFLLGP